MDVIFGTYRCPDHEPERFGIKEPTPWSYVGFMFRPLLPRLRTRKAEVPIPVEAAPAATTPPGVVAVNVRETRAEAEELMPTAGAK
jgi:hypothetical protein